MIDGLRLALGWVLPWLAGIGVLSIARPIPGRPVRAEIAWTTGCGFFAGAFILTLWMRVLSLAGIPFSVVSIAAPLAFFTLGCAALAWRRAGSLAHAIARTAASEREKPASRAMRILWIAVAGWTVLRLLMLLFEVIWTPLYPWDAWIQWATKARVWYAQGRIVPFASSDAWFAANGAAWLDASPDYPATVPLWQVWSSIVLGRWDDALMNVPWWLTAVALALAIYGVLRASGTTAITAIIGAWLVASLPLANVHTALAGYADLPLAACYALSVLALWRWSQSRSATDAALAALLAAACITIKTPGIVWASTLLPAVVIVVLPRYGMKIVAVGLAIALAALLVLARTEPVVLGYRLHLEFAPAWSGLLDTFFLEGNWHLLWYAAIAIAALASTEWRSPRVRPLSVVVGVGLFFLGVVFAFTNARDYVTDQTTINRAALHIAPLVAVWVVLVADAWLARRGSAGGESVAMPAGPPEAPAAPAP